MVTAEATVDAVASEVTPRAAREWYDPDSVVFQALDDGLDRRAVVDADDDDPIEVMKAAGITAR